MRIPGWETEPGDLAVLRKSLTRRLLLLTSMLLLVLLPPAVALAAQPLPYKDGYFYGGGYATTVGWDYRNYNDVFRTTGWWGSACYFDTNGVCVINKNNTTDYPIHLGPSSTKKAGCQNTDSVTLYFYCETTT